MQAAREPLSGSTGKTRALLRLYPRKGLKKAANPSKTIEEKAAEPTANSLPPCWGAACSSFSPTVSLELAGKGQNAYLPLLSARWDPLRRRDPYVPFAAQTAGSSNPLTAYNFTM